MDLTGLICRTQVPEPWAEGEKIPWDEPGFSERMLREHLSQEHGLASRRFLTIDAHVAWIYRTLLRHTPSRVLDLCCGPGLYASRLACLGHECVGIDFSPASIAYADEAAARDGLACRYYLDDVRTADFGTGFDLAMMIFGEFNTFRPAEARQILRAAYRALATGGYLLFEPSTFESVRDEGRRGPSWYSSQAGLFSDEPHLCLTEHFWDSRVCAATTRYFVVGSDGRVTRYASSSQAYTGADFNALLSDCGFTNQVTYPSLKGVVDQTQAELIAIVAQKPG